MKTKEEIRVMALQAIASTPPEVGREAWDRCFLVALEGTKLLTP